MIRATCIALSVLLFLVAWTPAAEGQWLPEPAPWITEAHVETPTVVLDPATERAPFLHILGGAALGAAAGAGAGMLMGSTGVGPWVGGAVGAGIGASAVTHGQGIFLLTVAAALPAGLLMALPMMAAHWEGTPDGTTLVLLAAGFGVTQGSAAALVEWWTAGR
jgi:hypothetical protein